MLTSTGWWVEGFLANSQNNCHSRYNLLQKSKWFGYTLMRSLRELLKAQLDCWAWACSWNIRLQLPKPNASFPGVQWSQHNCFKELKLGHYISTLMHSKAPFCLGIKQLVSTHLWAHTISAIKVYLLQGYLQKQYLLIKASRRKQISCSWKRNTGSWSL